MVRLEIERLFPAHPLPEDGASGLKLAVDRRRPDVSAALELVDQRITDLVKDRNGHQQLVSKLANVADARRWKSYLVEMKRQSDNPSV